MENEKKRERDESHILSGHACTCVSAFFPFGKALKDVTASAPISLYFLFELEGAPLSKACHGNSRSGLVVRAQGPPKGCNYCTGRQAAVD